MKSVDKFISEHPIKKLIVNNISGEYLVGGTSSTGFLIFLGGGQDLYSSYDFIHAYKKQYKVITTNITGFQDLTTYFQFVNKILNEERVNKAIIYGLSFGGFLAQHYIRRNKDRVLKLVLSHTASTRSKKLIIKVIIPIKIGFFLVSVIPLNLLRFIVKKHSIRVQSRIVNIFGLWKKYSSEINFKRRMAFFARFGLNFLNKEYLKSFKKLGIEMKKEEKKWSFDDLKEWNKKILIIKTDNDPLMKDDGTLKKYYPESKEHIFHHTGHLTPFIQFEKMRHVIDEFIEK